MPVWALRFMGQTEQGMQTMMSRIPDNISLESVRATWAAGLYLYRTDFPVQPEAKVWALMAICLLAIPAGIWLGWRLHGALDQRQVYRACYGLLVVTALKLLWDGVSGYL